MKVIIDTLAFDPYPDDAEAPAFFLKPAQFDGWVQIGLNVDDPDGGWHTEWVDIPASVLKEMALHLNQLGTEVLPLAEEIPTPSLLADFDERWEKAGGP